MTGSTKGLAPVAEAKVGSVLRTVSLWLAFAGGVLLTSAAIMTVISIIGRRFIWAGLGPVPGDIELVELACVIAVFAFLPWGQINRGQVTVDFLVDRFPARIRAFLGMLGDGALAVASIVIAWRLWKGFGEKFPFGSDTLRNQLALGDRPYYTETTFILELPLWIGYAFAMIGAIIFAIVCIYTVWRAFNWTLRGHEDVIR